MESAAVQHTIDPVFNEQSEVLVLGSMPSPASRAVGFYYGHARNRFWPVIARLFDEPLATTTARRADQALRHHIALWDVLKSCTIEGASDASIKCAVPNDLARITDVAHISAVFCTGAKSAELYRRLLLPTTGIPCVQLPSTSPANAAKSLDQLTAAYAEALLPHLHETPDQALSVADVVALEQRIANAGTSLAELMERAGTWIAYRTLKQESAQNIAIACGSGNNGGDGWVAARELAATGKQVTLITPKQPADIHALPARDAACASAQTESFELLVDPSFEQVECALAHADVVIDAILGTGFSGTEVKEPYNTWIDLINQARNRGAFVVAADVPSGLNADTGCAQTAVIADETVTMIAPKKGLLTPNATPYCGTVITAPLALIP